MAVWNRMLVCGTDILRPVIFVFFALMAHAGRGQTRVTAEFEGFVHDGQNQPVEGARISAGASAKASVLSDVFGHFSLQLVTSVRPGDRLSIQIEKTGFQPLRQDVGLSSVAQIFTLKRHPRTKAATDDNLVRVRFGVASGVEAGMEDRMSVPAGGLAIIGTPAPVHIVTVPVVAQVIGPRAARGLHVWIRICSTCLWMDTLPGFNAPRDGEYVDTERDKEYGDLLAGAVAPIADVKMATPWHAKEVQISVGYTCLNCPPADPKKATIIPIQLTFPDQSTSTYTNAPTAAPSASAPIAPGPSSLTGVPTASPASIPIASPFSKIQSLTRDLQNVMTNYYPNDLIDISQDHAAHPERVGGTSLSQGDMEKRDGEDLQGRYDNELSIHQQYLNWVNKFGSVRQAVLDCSGRTANQRIDDDRRFRAADARASVVWGINQLKKERLDADKFRDIYAYTKDLVSLAGDHLACGN